MMFTQQQQDDIALLQSALPSMQRVTVLINRLDYLEQTNTHSAVIGRVYQSAVNDWANEHRENLQWVRPEPDPLLTSKIDKIWRLLELMQDLYPEITTAVHSQAKDDSSATPC